MTQAHFFNFCGFLVQSVPCMLLCLRPFPPESFSIRRKYMVSFFGSLLLAAAAVFSFFACLPANQHGKDGLPLSLEFYANLFMAATLILCILLMFRMIRESLWKKLLINQFHDILPGSHITPVYRDTMADYSEIEEKLASIGYTYDEKANRFV